MCGVLSLPFTLTLWLSLYEGSYLSALVITRSKSRLTRFQSHSLSLTVPCCRCLEQCSPRCADHSATYRRPGGSDSTAATQPRGCQHTVRLWRSASAPRMPSDPGCTCSRTINRLLSVGIETQRCFWRLRVAQCVCESVRCCISSCEAVAEGVRRRGPADRELRRVSSACGVSMVSKCGSGRSSV